jgi:transcriptional regulator with XRE-family HTH domain
MSSNYQIKFDNFSDALRKALEINDINLILFSKMIGKDNAQASRYLNGVNIPGHEIRKKINEVLNVSITKQDNCWILDTLRPEEFAVNDTSVTYAAQVELPKDGRLSRDQIVKLLEQIELMTQMIRDSLK